MIWGSSVSGQSSVFKNHIDIRFVCTSILLSVSSQSKSIMCIFKGRLTFAIGCETSLASRLAIGVLSYNVLVRDENEEGPASLTPVDGDIV